MTGVVAVTAPRRVVDGRDRVVFNVRYVHALEDAGLVPLGLPTLLAPHHAAAALDHVRGLVLTGGEDVAPGRYGAQPHPKLGPVDLARDAAELQLIATALGRRLPILGICRGMQILNVALGGTLYQDLDSERPSPVQHAAERDHAVRVEPESTLATALGVHDGLVHSRHHQAIRDLASGLRAVAWAEDGLIEAVEAAEPGAPWLVAVQWHAEERPDSGLFHAFAQAVA